MPESIPDFDLYAELGVAPDADADAIRVAHREAVRQVHPDVRVDDEDDEAKRLNVARDWLTDPTRRARYDESRGLGTWDTDEGAIDGSTDVASPSAESGISTRPGRRDAHALLELGWWLLLIAGAALIFLILLVIVAQR
jgi:curved DNA-binding protein CbpA